MAARKGVTIVELFLDSIMITYNHLKREGTIKVPAEKEQRDDEIFEIVKQGNSKLIRKLISRHINDSVEYNKGMMRQSLIEVTKRADHLE